MIESDKLISIIIPVYNIEDYIENCIKSIINQTYKNLEIILIDDGSTDRSGEICDQYSKEDERIIVVHKTNGGLSEARNRGIDVATGEYIGFVDGDDIIHPQMYEILLNKLLIDHTDMAVCGVKRTDRYDLQNYNNVENIKSQIITKDEAVVRINELESVAWNKIYSKKIFDELRYPIKKFHEDEYIIYEILHRCDAISLLEKNYPLYCYIKRGSSIMGNLSEKRIIDAIESFEVKFDIIKKYNWDDVIPITIEKYCEYCAKLYFEITGKNHPECKKYKRKLFVWEKEIIKKYKEYHIPRRYKIFALNPILYLFYIRIVLIVSEAKTRKKR